ncbi:hypothetical protein [uncultured Bradyrhizobium sp.]|uniref:hypothetical protein n=1 Tax=uncultured Bradyrhizobium sp. TaxID=199684 RepID=UPI0035CAD9EA
MFEGPFAPVDWGTTAASGTGKNRHCLRMLTRLLARYRPEVLLLQDTSEEIRRAARIRSLHVAIKAFAEDEGVRVVLVARGDVRKTFSYLDAPTKHQIAVAISRHVPVFERLLPRVRKPWMSEDARMGIFDAAGLVFAYYDGGAQKRGRARRYKSGFQENEGDDDWI